MKTNLFVRKQVDGKLTVSGKCVCCQKTHEVKNVSEELYNRWKRGELITNLVDITIDDATFLVFGDCPECQTLTNPEDRHIETSEERPFRSIAEIIEEERYVEQNKIVLEWVAQQNGLDLKKNREFKIARQIISNSLVNN